MAIKVKIANNVQDPALALFDTFDDVLFNMEVVSATSSKIVAESGDRKAVIKGSGFTFTEVDGIQYLNGGTADSINYDLLGGGDLVDITNLNITGQQVFNVSRAEDTEQDLAAVENLLLSQDYDYVGNGSADILKKGTQTPDGVTVNFKGDDEFDLKGGNDEFFTGNGEDKAFGGAGSDKIWGGKGADRLEGGKGKDKLWGEDGKDKLFGDGGNDALYGDAGDDKLYGGSDKDKLFGGSGKDVLWGGKGSDTLKGGGGADVFNFVNGNNLGNDRIKDFDDGTDKIALDFEEVLSIKNKNGNAVIDYERGTITIEGVSRSDITSDDFV